MFYGTNHGLLLSMTNAKFYTQCLVVILEIFVFFAQMKCGKNIPVIL